MTGVGISDGIWAVGGRKGRELGLEDTVTVERQVCLTLTFADNRCDAVTLAFGVRNFQRLQQGFAEMYRVLKPGGVLMVIELSEPTRFPVHQLYRLYAHGVIPLWGRLFSRDRQAYVYLPRSVDAVPQGEEMLSIFRSVGFEKTRCRRLTMGVCSIYWGQK